ncbi:hypothetical protein ACIQUF_10325 [Pseudomonas sp. NPDC090233]|uniref:hypothetical protein n=1 Tax=Pseudomonas sp. NPDC090233 TaxID=3364479 RepID=UPI00383B6BBD
MNAPFNKPGKTDRQRTVKPTAMNQATIPVRDEATGIIRRPDLENNVLVEVPKGLEFRNTLTIQLFINNDFDDPNNRIGDPLDLAGFDLADPQLVKFDLFYKVTEFPADGTDETVSLNYYLFDADSEAGIAATPLNVRFDRKAPGGDEPPPIAFTADQLSGITDADIDGSDQLNMLIDPFFGGETGDIVELWLGESETSGSYLTPTFTVQNPRNQLPVYLTRNDLNTAGDARTLFFGYRVTDFAGNVSAQSNLIGIPVFINLPTLLAPLVPESDDGLVIFTDANPSVSVEIPQYPGAADSDTITVIWGGIRTTSYSLGQGEGNNDPVAILEVPYDVVKAAGDGHDIPVTYEMLRGANPVVPSPVTNVPVNLTTPGGPNPDPDLGTPEHDNIKPPSIQCGTSPVNTISPADFHLPATATTFRQGVDNNPIWRVGDVIQMHWGTVSNPEIASVPVVPGNEGANIPVPIPFAGVIEAVGVGPITTFFTITRELPAPSGGTVPVTVSSPVQIVQVASADALPGDGQQLRAGTFPEANARNIITRAAGINGTTFRILLDGVTNIDGTGATVSYDFVGVQSGDAGSLPNPPPAPIEQSRVKADDVPLTADHIAQGYFEINLPYSTTYYICRNGATLNYSLANTTGRNSNTLPAFVRFAMDIPDSGCSLPTFGNLSSMATLSSGSAGHVTYSVPVNLPAIAFTDDQRSGITEEDLEGGVLTASVNAYFDSQPGDVITPWLGESELTGMYLEPTSTVEPGTKTPIHFKRSDLIKGNRQRLFFGYRVTTARSEESELSRLVDIEINLDMK